MAHLVLDRPEAGNTFTAQLLAELAAATRRLATEPALRAVVLRGAGENFCYGASVDMFLAVAPGERPALLRDLVTDFHAAVSGLQRLAVPVMGVAHGLVVGGGVALIAACDVVLAAASCRFRLAWSALGITMDGGSTFLLPRIVGTHRTLEWIYTNRILDAAEAQAWGLVNWTVPHAELESRAGELSSQLAAAPRRRWEPASASSSKARASPSRPIWSTRPRPWCARSRPRDADEGLTAFRDKRRPRFTGD